MFLFTEKHCDKPTVCPILEPPHFVDAKGVRNDCFQYDDLDVFLSGLGPVTVPPMPLQISSTGSNAKVLLSSHHEWWWRGF
jgi:hypothetical protein